MTLPVFVVDPAALSAETVELAGAEGRHAATVKRIRVGERITLTDGAGNGADCEVLSVDKQGLVATVLVRRHEPPPQPRLVVVQAIPKGEHAERAVDLLTEAGADVIVPWTASRNIVRWKGERAQKALQRWRSTVHAAAKQSRRLRSPEVTAALSTDQVAELVGSATRALVLHEDAADATALDHLPDEGDIVLVVGPEGGITDDELAAFTGRGALAVRLGPTVLRTSTAGLVAVSAVLSRTRRWR